MTTHTFQQGSGFKVTGGTGGVSGGGGGSAPAGTTTIEEIQSETGSNEAGVQASQIGFANAPASAAASSRVTLKWSTLTSTKCSLIVEDDSSASGESGTSDVTASTRPVASRPPTLNNFEDANGFESPASYSRSSPQYYAVELYQGGAEPETFQGPIYWNGTQIYAGSMTPGTVWSPNMTYVHTDGLTYKVGSYQEVFNDDTYYSITRGIPTEEHYRFTASNTITKLKMDYEVNTLTTASGVVVPLRTLAGNLISSGSNSSGWITSSLSTGITLNIQQIIGSVSDDLKVHVTDGIVKLYAGDSSNEGLLKQFRLRVYTSATSTY
jgi:hypothetical protein